MVTEDGNEGYGPFAPDPDDAGGLGTGVGPLGRVWSGRMVDAAALIGAAEEGRVMMSLVSNPLTRLVKRCGCLLLLSLLLLAALVCGLWTLVIHTYAATEKPGAVLLVAAHPAAAPARTMRGVFVHTRREVTVPGATCTVQLAGDAAGLAPFAVDDRLTLIAHQSDGSTRQWQHDFRAGGHIVPRPPTDLSPALGHALYDLEIILEDLEPDTWGNTDLWLLPCANAAAPPSPTPPASRPTPGAAIPASPTRTPGGAGGAGSGASLNSGLILGASAGGALLLGIGLLVACRRQQQRPRLTTGAPQYWLMVYDAETGEQLQQALAESALPVGIARHPLRLVAAALPEVAALLAITPGTQQPGLLAAVPTPPLRVQLDGLLLDGPAGTAQVGEAPGMGVAG